jgi:hypothetical protein
MLVCPKCKTEVVNPDHKFCVECKTELDGPPSSEESEASSDLPASIGGSSTVVAAPEPSAEGTARTSRTNVVGEHNITGDNVTVIQYAAPEGSAALYCGVGHESILPGGRSYQCPDCERLPVCAEHFAPEKRRCVDCVQKSEAFIRTLEEPDIVIDQMGQVREQSTVRAVGDTLVSETGERVATIKPNIWYAPAKQWYQVKPRLLGRERRAVTSMYPGMEMGKTSKGSIFWAGTLTTASGNAYDVRIQYPSNFPYIPPRAYVVRPKIKESRHIYKDGHLCMFHKDDKVWQNETTAATVVSWTALWLHCYEVWVDTGEWPRRERDQVVVQTAY